MIVVTYSTSSAAGKRLARARHATRMVSFPPCPCLQGRRFDRLGKTHALRVRLLLLLEYPVPCNCASGGALHWDFSVIFLACLSSEAEMSFTLPWSALTFQIVRFSLARIDSGAVIKVLPQPLTDLVRNTEIPTQILVKGLSIILLERVVLHFQFQIMFTKPSGYQIRWRSALISRPFLQDIMSNHVCLYISSSTIASNM